MLENIKKKKRENNEYCSISYDFFQRFNFSLTASESPWLFSTLEIFYFLTTS